MKVVQATMNFTGGELSPKVRGRVDVQQYLAGARQLRNALPAVTGGAMSRVGTTYTATAKHADKVCRLIPWSTKAGAVYVLEVGELYARIFKDGAAIGAPLEIAHPYTEAQVQDIDHAQDADTLYMTHADVAPQIIKRFSDSLWYQGPVAFTAPPDDEVGLRFASALTLSATTVGSGRTATSGSSIFLAADVGRGILYNAGVFVITSIGGGTVATGDITVPFDTASLPANGWKLEGSPQANLTPSAEGPVGATITLTLSAAGWRSASDIGAHVRVNGGLCLITGFTSDTIVDAVVQSELTNIVAAPKLAWQILYPTWNAFDGYPRTITFHQQRLVAAGSEAFPQTIWGSFVGDPLTWTVGTGDSDGYAFTIGSDENNEIAWVMSGRHLLALTYGAEYSLRGQAAKTVISTASPPDVIPESNNGANGAVRPVQIKREAFFVQRSAKEVRSMGYRFDFDGYDSPDTTALSQHLFARAEDGSSITVVSMAYQQRPHSLLWCALSDGTVACLTIDRGQNVSAWSLHDVGGVVESLCCVPGADGDVLYLAVKRTINGSTARYIERMEFTTTSTRASEQHLMQVDMGKFIYNAGGQTTATHAQLPNTEVDVLADGVYAGRFTTDGSGVVTLPRTAYSIQIGLPFTTTIEPNTPEDPQTIGQRQSTSKVILRLTDSGPIMVNGQQLEMRNFGGSLLDQAVTLFDGDIPISELGWYDGADPVVIERTLPFPVHVLAVIRDLSVNA